jgi:hypothetical protein
MNGCTARNALEGFTRQMKKLPAVLRESLTYDPDQASNYTPRRCQLAGCEMERRQV